MALAIFVFLIQNTDLTFETNGPGYQTNAAYYVQNGSLNYDINTIAIKQC